VAVLVVPVMASQGVTAVPVAAVLMVLVGQQALEVQVIHRRLRLVKVTTVALGSKTTHTEAAVAVALRL
jgi:hypothetical protein